MSTFKVLLAMLVLTLGCATREPPSAISIDPAFSAAEQATIESAVDAWCLEVGWCPARATWVERGRIFLVDHVDMPSDMECPEGFECETAGINDGDNVRISRARFDADDMGALWADVAHEVGHYCADHTDSGLMAEVRIAGVALEVDTAAVAAWRAGCP